MQNNHPSSIFARAARWPATRLLLGTVLLLAAAWPLASRAVTLSDTPVATVRSTSVKPNIMILMDTSTSMSFTHMPDEVEGDRLIMRVGYTSYQCNTLYYSPNRTYDLPKRADGTTLPEAVFATAAYNYFIDFPTHSYPGADTTKLRDLGSNFQAWDANTRRNFGAADTAQAAYYWEYTAADNTKPASLSYGSSACLDTFPLLTSINTFVATGGGRWNKTVISTAADKTKFARWYQYYRTRMALMKSGMSLAFNAPDPVMDDRFRIGLVSVNPYPTDASGNITDSSSVLASKYEPLRAFDNTQRQLWFNKLFAQIAEGASPAREGLARVGRHYANKTDLTNAGMSYATNLFEYTCQQNFTIMTTDGYWNTSNETRGPIGVDGTRIGQMDGTLTDIAGNSPRPIWDGSTTGTSATTSQNDQYRTVPCSGGYFARVERRSQQRVMQYQEKTEQLQTRDEKYVKTSRQNLANTGAYTESTHRWYQTQQQRQRDTYQVMQSSVRNTERSHLQRGGGTLTWYQRTQYTTQRTETYQSTTTSYFRDQWQWMLASTQKSEEQYRFYSNQQKMLRLEYWQEQQDQQNWQTKKQTKETSTTTYGTYSQIWGTAWRYEVLVSERYVPASAATCVLAGANCRIRDVLRDQIVSTPPTTTSALDSCPTIANRSPQASNDYTTTTCESQTRYFNVDGVYQGTTPVEFATTSCTAGTVNKTTTACRVVSVNAVAVASCTVGTDATTKKITTLCDVITAQDKVPVSTCSPSTGGGPDYYVITCGNNDVAYRTVQYGTCTPQSKSPTEYKAIACRYVWKTTSAGATSNSTTAPSTTPVLNFAGFAGYAVHPTTGCTAVSSGTGTRVQCDNASSFAVTNNVATNPTGGNAAAGTLTCVDVAGTTTPFLKVTCITPKTAVSPLTYKASCTGSTGDTVSTQATGYIVTHCVNTVTGPTAQASDCTALRQTGAPGNDFKDITCTKTWAASPNGQAIPTNPATCSSPAPTATAYNFSSCYNTAPVVTYGSTACVPKASNVSPFQSVTCSNNDISARVDPATCTNQSVDSTHNSKITCTPYNQEVQVGSCSPQTGDGAHNWTTITCRSVLNPGTAPTCDPAHPELCYVVDVPDHNVQACFFPPPQGVEQSSTPTQSVWYKQDPATGIEYWCTQIREVEAAVQDCTPGGGGNAPQYKQVACRNTTTVSDFVTTATCSGTSKGSASNWYHTNCYDVYVNVSGVPQNDVPVDTCTATPAANLTTTVIRTTCREDTFTNVAVVSCTNPNAGVQPASADPNHWQRNCVYTTQNNVPVNTCTVQGPSATNSFVATLSCPTPVTTGPTAVATCTGNTQTKLQSNSWVQIDCSSPTGYPTAWLGTETCATGLDGATGIYKNCRTVYNPTPSTSFNYVQACTFGLGVTAASATNSWVKTTCQVASGSTYDTPSSSFVYQPVDTCSPQTASSTNNWLNVECQSTVSPAVGDPLNITTSCSPQTANTGNGWIHVDCTPLDGKQAQYNGVTTRTYNVLSGAQVVTSTNTTLYDTGWTNIGSCQSPTATITYPANPTPSEMLTKIANAVVVAPELISCSAFPCTATSPANSGGSKSSLADVAQYYYVTDLMPNGTSTVGTITPKSTRSGPEDDRATQAHMTTFVIGMGVSGNLNFRDDYKDATTGDFANIRGGSLGWPVWPAPVSSFSTRVPAVALDANENYNYQSLYDDPRSIDDFWHTAVNGRGQYFSAGEPSKIISGLGSALTTIDRATGAGGGATTSSLSPTQGDDKAFIASFGTKTWDGELEGRPLNLTTGDVGVASIWTKTASEQLKDKVGDACDNRNIYFFKSGATNNRNNFAWNTKNCDVTTKLPTGSNLADGLSSTEQAYFSLAATTSHMTQFSPPYNDVGNTQQSDAAGAALVNYLRGQTGSQGFVKATTKYFRTRASPLGTIVNSQPLYVKAPNREYSDSGYFSFRSANASRAATVYVGANDGMLHAFNAATGAESWAWVPSMVMADMWHLGDVNYAHKFLVDGSPVSGDFYDAAASTPAWKTMLVAGLNNGGRGYFALDVTDPASPKGMWEFKGATSCAGNPVGQTSDCDLGQTFGRPIITKIASGQWVVIITSGYNNTSGDGKGHLYVLNASNGQIISKINTTGTGLREINSYVGNITTNNTAQRVYGGDLDGNIWRFDINDIYAPTGKEATLVGRTMTPDNAAAQPITIRPILAEVGGKTLIFVGTGQLLSAGDLTVTTPAPKQSVYAIIDSAIGAATDGVHADVAYPPESPTGRLRAVLKPLAFQTQSDGTRTVTCTSSSDAVCAAQAGWVIDLPDAGERVNIDMAAALGTLSFDSNVPSTSQACDVGGYAWRNYVNMTTGLPVSQGSGVTTASRPLFGTLSVGLGLIVLPSGQVVGISRGADGRIKSDVLPTSNPGPEGRRVSWREVTQ